VVLRCHRSAEGRATHRRRGASIMIPGVSAATIVKAIGVARRENQIERSRNVSNLDGLYGRVEGDDVPQGLIQTAFGDEADELSQA